MVGQPDNHRKPIKGYIQVRQVFYLISGFGSRSPIPYPAANKSVSLGRPLCFRDSGFFHLAQMASANPQPSGSGHAAQPLLCPAAFTPRIERARSIASASTSGLLSFTSKLLNDSISDILWRSALRHLRIEQPKDRVSGRQETASKAVPAVISKRFRSRIVVLLIVTIRPDGLLSRDFHHGSSVTGSYRLSN